MQKASGKKNQKHFNPAIGLLFLALFALAVGCYLIVFIRQSESLNA